MTRANVSGSPISGRSAAISVLSEGQKRPGGRRTSPPSDYVVLALVPHSSPPVKGGDFLLNPGHLSGSGYGKTAVRPCGPEDRKNSAGTARLSVSQRQSA